MIDILVKLGIVFCYAFLIIATVYLLSCLARYLGFLVAEFNFARMKHELQLKQRYVEEQSKNTTPIPDKKD